MKKKRFKLVPAVYLILEKDNSVLLQRRFNTGYEDGNYSLIAGHLDGNESASTAILREAYEEAGITMDVKDLEVAHVMHRKTKTVENERIDIFFTIKKWSGEPRIIEKNKSDDLKWFSKNNLPENIIPYIKTALDNYYQGIIFSELGWNK